MSKAILFDHDQVTHLTDLAERPGRLGRSRLLWVDIDRADEEDAEKVGDAFGLDQTTRNRLAGSTGRAVFYDRGDYIHVTTYTPSEDDEGELVSRFSAPHPGLRRGRADDGVPLLAGRRTLAAAAQPASWPNG